MAKRGRKTKYSESFVEEFLGYIREGDTEKAAAERAGVSVSSLEKWKGEYAEFSQELKRVHQEVDRMMVQEVEKSLYRRALGYQYDEKKITNDKDGLSVTMTTKEVVPDVGAIVFVLTNRAPDRWKNKQVQESKVDISGSGLKIEVMDDETAKVLKRIADGDEDDKSVQ